MIGLPPRNTRALARAGPFLLPAIRPALALSAEAGWSEVSSRAQQTLERLEARTTDGIRPAVGVGLSLFDDAITLEWIRPLEEGRPGRWYFGLVRWH